MHVLQILVATKNPEPVESLAKIILDEKADLVALEEVSIWVCTEIVKGDSACDALSAAMNDHLDLTLSELGDGLNTMQPPFLMIIMV